MQTKKWSILLGALGVGLATWLIFTEDQDAEKTREMLQQKQILASQTSDQKAASRIQRSDFRLTEKLLATRELGSTDWTVKAGSDFTWAILPFRPPADGKLTSVESGTKFAAGLGSSNDEAPAQNQVAPSQEERDQEPGQVQVQGPGNELGLVGANACAECHADRHASFVHTSHHKTSQSATTLANEAPFESPSNVLRTSDPDLSFLMTRRDDGAFQTLRLADWSMEFPMEFVTGSAKTGQTFLYWLGDSLYQDHVSYISGPNQWIASPGLPETNAYYNRAVRVECLECHVTYIQEKMSTHAENVYYRDSVIWGISCERCHGPGKQHIDFHHAHPDAKQGKHIADPSELSRERQLDICAQCHSGMFSFESDPFTYLPGEDITKHHKELVQEGSGASGIHTSNQLSRLKLSRCFEASEMTCTSCHDPHQNQRGKSEVFTQSCLACHQPAHCGMAEKLGERISDDCISCHMPMSANESMQINLDRGSFTVSMADHFIRIDDKATQNYLQNNGLDVEQRN